MKDIIHVQKRESFVSATMYSFVAWAAINLILCDHYSSFLGNILPIHTVYAKLKAFDDAFILIIKKLWL